ncbi:hypothetical protein BU25DRAFT_460877 [Macroventuria anomochaeta]|uniref:Uncharacterized protein n=1 Tax=Macroventuria anomochaeta TaxID=301207 RepID=A0ACB6RU80_9PLEO|nr:uncharacterized protein BU25DRAFT_460877 [Macroventuria anomochaeta]KAF2624704.1 hypothetical protein BU25DRAFT_460877 [Macroventuria anomochaeta]
MLPSLAYSFKAFYLKIFRVMKNSAANVSTVEKAKLKWEPLNRKYQAKIEGLTNLISEVTDTIYVEAYNTMLANPKAKWQYKQSVEPKLKFQRKKLGEMFLQSDNHFVEQVINHFQSEVDKAMRHTLDRHFSGIEKLLNGLNTAIRAQGPITYRIPTLQERIDRLRALLPARVSQEENNEGIQIDSIDVKEEEDNFASIHEKMSKRKKSEPTAGVKQEPL